MSVMLTPEALTDFDTKYPHSSKARISVSNLEDVPEHWNLPFHQPALKRTPLRYCAVI